MTGFTAAVKLAIRVRAGAGDPDAAGCENCGAWLGRYDGQCQHRVARQMGGSRLRNTVVNGGLLCGTPQSLCHGACERRTPETHARGWWLRSTDDPAVFPVTHALYGLVWLLPDGSVAREAVAS